MGKGLRIERRTFSAILVAVESRGRVSLAHAVAETPGDAAQHPVAERCAEPGVERREAVQVDVDHPDAGTVTVGLGDGHGEAVRDEQRAREAGEGVAVDVAARGGPLVHHLLHQHLQGGTPAVDDGGHDPLDLSERPVGPAQAGREAGAAVAGGLRPRDDASGLRTLVRMDEVDERAPRHRNRGLQAQEPPERGVGECDPPRDLDHERVGDGRRQGLVALFALPQGLGGAAALRQVPQGHLQAAVGEA
jgi:hypothetical protein